MQKTYPFSIYKKLLSYLNLDETGSNYPKVRDSFVCLFVLFVCVFDIVVIEPYKQGENFSLFHNEPEILQEYKT